MELISNHIPTLITALKSFLSPFKIDGNPIPLYIKGFSQEGATIDFPYFYVKSFRLVHDLSRRHSDKKYIYEKAQDNSSAEKKIRQEPYLLVFVLEYLDTNPINFYQVYELLERKLNRDKQLPLTYPSGDEVLNLYFSPASINEQSEVLHVFWEVRVETVIEPTISKDSTTDIINTVDVIYSEE